MDNSKNTKELFRIVNNHMGSNTDHPLPSGKTTEEIAKSFAEFFSNKITKLQQSFTGTLQYHLEKTNTPHFTSFKPLPHDAVKREIMGMKNKSCILEQISTSMLKEINATCLPTITHIVNMSLTRGNFTADWKLAIVRPLLENLYTRTANLSQTYPSSPSWLSDAYYNSYWSTALNKISYQTSNLPTIRSIAQKPGY